MENTVQQAEPIISIRHIFNHAIIFVITTKIKLLI